MAKHSSAKLISVSNQISQLHETRHTTPFALRLKRTEWNKLKGWHTLRHSFISNLACEGVDQRLIDEFVGHTTEEMRRRYRHLFPDVKSAAIASVFG